MRPRPIVVMGVSGTGKSLIGGMLAERLGVEFVDGDDLHPARNVAKMAAGHPLDDADRWPWLDAVGARLAPPHGPTVIACSALKRIYRQRIGVAAKRAVTFVLLSGDAALLRQRMDQREGHFMPPALLASQLATLELPGRDEHAITVDVTPPPAQVLAEALRLLPR